MRIGPIVFSLLLSALVPASAQVSFGISSGGVRIGINVSAYPELVPVPGYPVYYAPRLNSNYFFYDGLYWVYEGDRWYASSWYNGPWAFVGRDAVPAYLLRVPVRYYRSPPVYFRGWSAGSPPHWGERWGPAWEQQRHGWNDWDRHSSAPPAPLPTYQRQYAGPQYPRGEQQQSLHSRNYSYQPRDEAVRQHYQPQSQWQGATNSGPPASNRESQKASPGHSGQAPGREQGKEQSKGGGSGRDKDESHDNRDHAK
jgi:hypothetical protein